MELSLAEYCRSLPKVELHAHLNGSLSCQSMKQLHLCSGKETDGIAKLLDQWEKITMNDEEFSLDICFELFPIAQALTTTPEAVYKAALNVIQDFAADGVVYLELRSTPRAVHGFMDKFDYIKAIVDAIEKMKGPKIIVKLLVSLNRTQGKQVAEENLKVTLMAKRLYPDIIVGVDLSGNPKEGNIDDFLPVLENARRQGLKISVHCAEIPYEEEIMKILKFKPDRLGHGTCIHPEYGGSERLWEEFLKSNIPIEICQTSNVRCGTTTCYADHHLQCILKKQHPMTLATDDKGVFNTTLSLEFEKAATNFSLSKEDLFNLSVSSVEYAFCSEQEKIKVRNLFELWKHKN